MNDMRKLMESVEKLWEEANNLGEVDDAAAHFGYDLDDEDSMEEFFDWVHSEWHEVEYNEPELIPELLKGEVPDELLKGLQADEFYIADEALDGLAWDIAQANLPLEIEAFVNGDALVFRVVKEK
jgi:hypothetical protein